MNSLKNTIKLEVESPNYNFSCNINRRITLIHGDSATGKSSLTAILSTTLPGVHIKCDLSTVILHNDSWKAILTSSTNAIVIADDLWCAETAEFASVCKAMLVKNNLYLVLITRAELGNFEEAEKVQSNGDHFGRLSISLNEIYNFCTDGINHWLEHDKISFHEDFKKNDLILTEDTTDGYDFFDYHFKHVNRSTNGKDSIISDIKKYDKNLNIFLLIDSSAFGCHYEKLKRVILDAGYNVYFCYSYESFEYFLLCSNMLRFSPLVQYELNDTSYANRYISWETYFSDLINRSTYRKYYRCFHGKRSSFLADCYKIDCSECNAYKSSKCDMSLEPNVSKIIALLKDTIFEFFLKLPQKNTSTDDSSRTCVQNDQNTATTDMSTF